MNFLSLPLRECGLKFAVLQQISMAMRVTPLAGVWIEIRTLIATNLTFCVTPLAGVWIEMLELRPRY